MFVLKKTYDAKVAADARYIEALQTSHDHWLDEAKGWEAKFKKAVTDLEAKVRECDGLQKLANGLDKEFCKAVRERDSWQQTATTYAAELATARPLAEARQRRLERDRNRVRPSRSRSADKGKVL